MEPQVLGAWIGAVAVILAAIIAGIFAYLHYPPSPPPTPVVVPSTEPPTATPTPTPTWSFNISPNSVGSYSGQLGYYYTTVVAHVENHASDGDTHDLLASAFHLYPVINGSTAFNLTETLYFPSSSTDYSIAHNTEVDITLEFLVPSTRNRFDLHLDGVGSGWSYSVMPP